MPATKTSSPKVYNQQISRDVNCPAEKVFIFLIGPLFLEIYFVLLLIDIIATPRVETHKKVYYASVHQVAYTVLLVYSVPS